MRGLTDPILLWMLGLVNVVFSCVGMIACAAVVGLPLVLGTLALGHTTDAALIWLLYLSPLWVPIGCGAGLAVCSIFFRGYSRKPADEEETKAPAG